MAGDFLPPHQAPPSATFKLHVIVQQWKSRAICVTYFLIHKKAQCGWSCALRRQFFQSGKVLPIVRGQGIDQQAMRIAAARAAAGDWVHLFPEGRVIYGGRLGPSKWGVGKLVCDCVTTSGK